MWLVTVNVKEEKNVWLQQVYYHLDIKMCSGSSFENRTEYINTSVIGSNYPVSVVKST